MRADRELPAAADAYGRRASPYYDLTDKKAKYRADKLFKRLRRKTGRAIGDYGMIAAGDRVVVAVSGGKDSWALLDLLLSLRRSAPVPFTLIPVHIDPLFPGTPEGLVEGHLKRVGLPYHIVKFPIYRLCREKLPPGQPFCPLCSRLRRGRLYGVARELHADKLALGHHKDDILATFLLNIFYAGKLKAMPPVLRNDRDDLTVIRPLCCCRERDLALLSRLRRYPLLPKGLCGFGENQERAAMRGLIRSWDETDSRRADIVFRALSDVVPSHLYDRSLYDFGALSSGSGRRSGVDHEPGGEQNED